MRTNGPGGWVFVASLGPRPTFLGDAEFAGQGQGHDGMLAHEGREAPCREQAALCEKAFPHHLPAQEGLAHPGPEAAGATYQSRAPHLLL